MFSELSTQGKFLPLWLPTAGKAWVLGWGDFGTAGTFFFQAPLFENGT